MTKEEVKLYLANIISGIEGSRKIDHYIRYAKNIGDRHEVRAIKRTDKFLKKIDKIDGIQKSSVILLVNGICSYLILQDLALMGVDNGTNN